MGRTVSSELTGSTKGKKMERMFCEEVEDMGESVNHRTTPEGTVERLGGRGEVRERKHKVAEKGWRR